MKEKIFLALKNRYKNLGFGDAAITGVAEFLAATIQDEENIETGISGVEGLLKTFQKEIDRRVASVEPKPASPKETPASEPLSEIQKAIADALKPLSEELQTLKAQKQAETYQQQLIGQLKEKNIDPLFYSLAIEGRTFTDEQQVQTFANELETKFKAYQQSQADQGLEQQGQPQKGDATQLKQKAVLADIERLANF